MSEGCCRIPAVEFYEERFESTLKRFIPVSFHPGGSETTRRLIEEACVDRGSLILDVASGFGDTAIYLAMNFGLNVVGLDLSRKMTSYANVLAEAVDLDDKVFFIVADAGRIPLRDNTFDAAISECTLCLIPNMLDVLKEMRRTIKPGAKVVISDVVLSEELPKELVSPLLHASCVSSARTLDKYISSFERAGLREVRVEDLTEIIINQINSFFGNESATFSFTDSYIRSLQRTVIDLWLTGKIKYYMVSGIK